MSPHTQSRPRPSCDPPRAASLGASSLEAGLAAELPPDGEGSGRLHAYERVLAVATALERRLSAAEAEFQKKEAAWAERVARADAYIAELESKLDEQEAIGRRSQATAEEETRRQRQRALELAFHRDERLQLDQTIAELRRRCTEQEQELLQLKAEHTRARPQNGAYEELSRNLAVQQVDDTLDHAESRRDAARRVDEAVRQARRLGLPLMCLMIGIDSPDALRRGHGSVAFDFLLVRVAQRLRQTLRQRDVVMRYGDGEFLLISDAKSVAAARSHAERLVRTVCAEPLEMGRRSVEVSLSIAVVPLDDEMTGAPDLLRRARHSLLAARAAGQRQVVVAAGLPATEADDGESLERPYHV